MNKPLITIFATIALDAAGIGLIFPILPTLVEEITHDTNVAFSIGALASLYAAMQFLFGPVLGALSDRLGRRPVILLSLAGATVDYLVMAFAPSLWILALGRAIAGLTSASLAVATAYLTDISPEHLRAKRFGLFNAMFGMGFILGPVVGGVLGDYWTRLPFIAAAALNGLNFLIAFAVLKETRAPSAEKLDLAALNPARPFRWVAKEKSLLPLVALFFLMSATGEVYGVCWALWGQDMFHWNGFWIGLSLGAFGICQTLAQALLPAPAVRRFGERTTVLIGIGGACAALTAMAFIREGWLVFVLMPLVALSGIGSPALQSLATRMVDGSRQGQFQGVLASAMSMASIVGPFVFSSIYFVVRDDWPGGIWLTALVVEAMAIPLVLGLRFQPARP